MVYVKATNPNYDETAEVKGTVTIDLAKLVVSTEGASKTYDGTPLTNPKNMAVGLAKAAGGKETVTLTNTGTITDVGKVENGYTITWDGTAKESNYTVADGEIGTLKVLPAAFEVQAEGYTM